jgi:hypothetical protein
MARPTQQEIQEWEARMSEPEETDSDDFEVVLFDEQGNPVGTMPFAKAKVYFAKRGISFDDDGPGTGTPTGTNAGTPANGQSAQPGGNTGAPGSPVPPTASRARPSARYFGKGATGSAGTTADPNDPLSGQQQ